MKLKDLPFEIQELALKRRMEQCDGSANLNLDSNLDAFPESGGFVWEATPEGLRFWCEINDGNFSPFYEKQSREKPEMSRDKDISDLDLKPGVYAKALEESEVNEDSSARTVRPTRASSMRETETARRYDGIDPSATLAIPDEAAFTGPGGVYKSVAEVSQEWEKYRPDYPTAAAGVFASNSRGDENTDSAGETRTIWLESAIPGDPVEVICNESEASELAHLCGGTLYITPEEFKSGADTHEGLRYNTGKPRYDLTHPAAQKGLVDVLTFGAQKYDDHNWTKGMAWSSVLASMKRHIAAIEAGEDYDPESGLLHIDHVQCNAHFLSAYYRIYPQGDDRLKWKMKQPKIALDIDEVICNWVGNWTDQRGMEIPKSWHFDRNLFQMFDKLRNEGKLDEFYSNLSPLIRPEDIPFEPFCYITKRPVSSEVTEKWLDAHGFPAVPVYTVQEGETKADIMLRVGADILIDDNYDTFVDCAKRGICCFLMTAPHNEKFNVGYRRLNSLKDLFRM